MSAVRTQFLYHQHGFQFINAFELKLPIRFQLPFGASVDLSRVVFGLCGGMCFSALDYFHLGEIPPHTEDVKSIDRKLFIYLCERQLDSLKIPTLLKVFDWMLMEDLTLANRLSRYEIPKLRRMLDKGEPAVLALIRVRGLDDPTQNHQVLATGYEFDLDEKKYRVSLYDPNHPRKNPYISIDVSNPRSGIALKQSTGEPLRGFFIIPYTASKTPPRFEPRTRSFTTTSRTLHPFHLCWPVDSRRVNQHFGANPATYKPFGLPGHEGIDLFALSGANIYAAASGEVTQSSHPKDHPYGLQIRLKHSGEGVVYQTIYAHLSKSMVKKGQKVEAGELIGLADNTGNSFGSHLHLTLKIEGAKTPGYPTGIVDPWPYLHDAAALPVESTPEKGGFLVYTTAGVNLRSEPNTQSQVLALLPAGEPLTILGDEEVSRQSIGVEGHWLQVKTASGQVGYVAAWFVQDVNQAFPPSDLVIYPYDAVNLRSGPGTAFSSLGMLTLDDPLTVLGDADLARAKLGKQGEWLQVQTEGGKRGFVAAWLVHSTGQTAPSSSLFVFPTVILNVRAKPSTDANILTIVAPQDKLVVLGSKEQAHARVGKADQWLNVQTPGGYNGYVAAWLVHALGDSPTQPSPTTDELLVYPINEINMRAQPALNAPRVGSASKNEPLRVIESDLAAAKEKTGKADLWIFAQNKTGVRGWLAAWLLKDAPV
jgi:murein DD-endopeptidase MepM/ murein hydrolase activator NlpD/SH3-like domain-containing protein